MDQGAAEGQQSKGRKAVEDVFSRSLMEQLTATAATGGAPASATKESPASALPAPHLPTPALPTSPVSAGSRKQRLPSDDAVDQGRSFEECLQEYGGSFEDEEPTTPPPRPVSCLLHGELRVLLPSFDLATQQFPLREVKATSGEDGSGRGNGGGPSGENTSDDVARSASKLQTSMASICAQEQGGEVGRAEAGAAAAVNLDFFKPPVQGALPVGGRVSPGSGHSSGSSSPGDVKDNYDKSSGDAATSGGFEVEVDDSFGGGTARATVHLVGRSPFASTVTKTFQCATCLSQSSLMIRVPRFRVVSKHLGGSSSLDDAHNGVLPCRHPSSAAAKALSGSRHAEYLVVVSAGAVTFGVWRRFTHFRTLAESIGLEGGRHAASSKGCGGKGSSGKLSAEALEEQFRMTHFSWAVLQRRRRLFRCLEPDYLAIKCFLLERFLHDLVFESSSPTTIQDFLGVW